MGDVPTPNSNEPFDQQSIDALLSEVAGQSAPGEGAAPTGGGFSQDEIDALMSASGDAPPASAVPQPAVEPDTRLDSMGRPFDDMAAAMMAAIEEEKTAAETSAPAAVAAPGVPVSTRPFAFPEFEGAGALGVDASRVSMVSDVKLNVRIELGRTRMLLEDVLKLGEGSVVELDRLAGDPVDVLVNGRLVARGEVLILNDNFCVRISEVLSSDPHRIAV